MFPLGVQSGCTTIEAFGRNVPHAKNFSLLRRECGEVVLAPLYDLVATRVWPELSARLAMRLGGAATLEEINDDSFVRFARDAGLTAPFVRRLAIKAR
ncbi:MULTISPECIES: HipA domain-containing protein [unclassified Novosphingobium]|uniref:HipA domain-containing protein n=1 Tax=unclassified Novosphingobium TaxID=2644732 RepID=UPI001F41D47D|nr:MULTISPECIES: HipA domain-containing protein [unclassified Novosphingobium]